MNKRLLNKGLLNKGLLNKGLLNKHVTNNVLESKGLVAHYLVIDERNCLSISFQRWKALDNCYLCCCCWLRYLWKEETFDEKILLSKPIFLKVLFLLPVVPFWALDLDKLLIHYSVTGFHLKVHLLICGIIYSLCTNARL